MSVAEQRLTVLALALLAMLVFGLAGCFVSACAWRVLRRQPAPRRGPAARWGRRIVLLLAGGGVACLLYGWLVEPYRLAQTHVHLTSPKLRGATRPIRIAHISDTHCETYKRLEDRLVEAVAAGRPDVIVFTGDAVNTRAAVPVFRELMTALAEIAPVYAVAGNWEDHWNPPLILYEGTAVRELTGQALPLEIAGTRVRLIGAGYGWWDRVRSAVGGADANDYRIVLYHHPDQAVDAAELGVDLYLAGHTHGGQVCLPGYGALITFSRFAKRFESGHSRVGSTDVYVTRGLGLEGGRAPRIRVWCPPELTWIELTRP